MQQWAINLDDQHPDYPEIIHVTECGKNRLNGDICIIYGSRIKDARLIAAAPELLEALIDSLDAMKALTMIRGLEPFIKRAENVIQKATSKI